MWLIYYSKESLKTSGVANETTQELEYYLPEGKSFEFSVKK